MNWRAKLAADFQQIVADYLVNDPRLLRLAVIDAFSVIDEAYRRYLVLDKKLALRHNVSFLDMLEEHHDALGLDRNALAHLNAFYKLRNHVVHQRVTPDRQMSRQQIAIIGLCLAAIKIDTAEALSALEAEKTVNSEVPRWEVERFLLERAETETFARLRQLFETLPESRRKIGLFRRQVFDQARRARIREVRLERISALESFLQTSFVKASYEDRKEQLEVAFGEGHLLIGEFAQLRELLDDLRRFGELTASLLEAEREAMASEDVGYEATDENQTASVD